MTSEHERAAHQLTAKFVVNVMLSDLKRYIKRGERFPIGPEAIGTLMARVIRKEIAFGDAKRIYRDLLDVFEHLRTEYGCVYVMGYPKGTA